MPTVGLCHAQTKCKLLLPSVVIHLQVELARVADVQTGGGGWGGGALFVVHSLPTT